MLDSGSSPVDGGVAVASETNANKGKLAGEQVFNRGSPKNSLPPPPSKKPPPPINTSMMQNARRKSADLGRVKEAPPSPPPPALKPQKMRSKSSSYVFAESPVVNDDMDSILTFPLAGSETVGTGGMYGTTSMEGKKEGPSILDVLRDESRKLDSETDPMEMDDDGGWRHLPEKLDNIELNAAIEILKRKISLVKSVNETQEREKAELLKKLTQIRSQITDIRIEMEELY